CRDRALARRIRLRISPRPAGRGRRDGGIDLGDGRPLGLAGPGSAVTHPATCTAGARWHPGGSARWGLYTREGGLGVRWNGLAWTSRSRLPRPLAPEWFAGTGLDGASLHLVGRDARPRPGRCHCATHLAPASVLTTASARLVAVRGAAGPGWR